MTDPLRRLTDAVELIRQATAARPLTGRTHDDAPDDVGTIATDDAVGFNPMPLLNAFHSFGARVVVIGQVAGILHGSPELTGGAESGLPITLGKR